MDTIATVKKGCLNRIGEMLCTVPLQYPLGAAIIPAGVVVHPYVIVLSTIPCDVNVRYSGLETFHAV
jgi:hypothetical protein